MTKIIHDVITDTYTEVELTEQELAERKKAQTLLLAEQAKRDAEQAVKDAARQAVLDKLGLSADEVAALLG